MCCRTIFSGLLFQGITGPLHKDKKISLFHKIMSLGRAYSLTVEFFFYFHICGNVNYNQKRLRGSCRANSELFALFLRQPQRV